MDCDRPRLKLIHIKLIKPLMEICQDYKSRIVRKRDFRLCENKGADQLRSNCETDRRLPFRYTDGTISPGLEIFLRTYSSCGASCKQFSLVLTAGALVLKIWISKETKIIKNECRPASTFLSTFDIKMEILDYLTFGVSHFITWR